MNDGSGDQRSLHILEEGTISEAYLDCDTVQLVFVLMDLQEQDRLLAGKEDWEIKWTVVKKKLDNRVDMNCLSCRGYVPSTHEPLLHVGSNPKQQIRRGHG